MGLRLRSTDTAMARVTSSTAGSLTRRPRSSATGGTMKLTFRAIEGRASRNPARAGSILCAVAGGSACAKCWRRLLVTAEVRGPACVPRQRGAGRLSGRGPVLAAACLMPRLIRPPTGIPEVAATSADSGHLVMMSPRNGRIYLRCGANAWSHHVSVRNVGQHGVVRIQGAGDDWSVAHPGLPRRRVWLCRVPDRVTCCCCCFLRAVSAATTWPSQFCRHRRPVTAPRL